MSYFKQKNILVTGGTGFVGSHLVEELANQGANVVTTFLELDPLSYFFSQKLNEKVVMVQADVEDFEKMHDIITKNNIEYIFHLAAQALVETAYYNPKRTLTTNIIGTINILESARLYPKVKGVIFASSDKAYGKLSKTSAVSARRSLSRTAEVKFSGKYVETDPLQGDHPYEVSKSAADLICYSYFKTYGVPVVTTRFGNIYGEGDLNFSRIIPGAIESIIKNKRLDIRSNGKFIRDYLYVKDVVEGYLLLAKNINKAKGEAYNFGSKETLSVLEVLKLIEKSLKTKIDYKILNTAKNEIPYQSLDFSKIKKLGWDPKNNIKSTINGIKDWYSLFIK